MTRPTDVASLFSPSPSRASYDLRYRQGTVRAWNSLTLENTIEVDDGTLLVNLPVLGIAEAATYNVGDVVGILLIVGERGMTWAIIGQLVAPATPQASEALSFLGGFVKGAASGGGTNFGDSTSYIDGSAADGPTVTDARIGPSGMALVIVSGQININVDHGPAWMSYAVSGATTSASTDERGLATGVTSGGGVLVKSRQSAMFLHGPGMTPLTPGLNTFKAQYRVTGGGGAAGDVNASNRNLIVIPL